MGLFRGSFNSSLWLKTENSACEQNIPPSLPSSRLKSLTKQSDNILKKPLEDQKSDEWSSLNYQTALLTHTSFIKLLSFIPDWLSIVGNRIVLFRWPFTYGLFYREQVKPNYSLFLQHSFQHLQVHPQVIYSQESCVLFPVNNPWVWIVFSLSSPSHPFPWNMPKKSKFVLK